MASLNLVCGESTLEGWDRAQLLFFFFFRVIYSFKQAFLFFI